MSHEATHWLAKLPASDLSASEFRVLFHLCDCHNPAYGCFPTQAYLIDAAGVSNGTLNNALRSLEDRGIIQRKRRHDDVQKKAMPTLYQLGFELDQDHTPDSGDRSEPYSNLDHDHTPTETTTILQPTGDKPVSNQVNKSVRERERAKLSLNSFSEDWKPDEDFVRLAWTQGFTDHDIEHETEKLIRYDGDKRHADLGKRWRVWMDRALEHRKKQATRHDSMLAGFEAAANQPTGHEELLRTAKEGIGY